MITAQKTQITAMTAARKSNSQALAPAIDRLCDAVRNPSLKSERD
jgi:hypothetical protein